VLPGLGKVPPVPGPPPVAPVTPPVAPAELVPPLPGAPPPLLVIVVPPVAATPESVFVEVLGTDGELHPTAPKRRSSAHLVTTGGDMESLFLRSQRS